MFSSFQLKRIQFEQQNLEENADQLPPDCTYQLNFTKKYNGFIVQYKGAKYTLYEGAYIVVDVELNSKYPLNPPIITFRNDFQHFNVQNGRLCLNITNTKSYQSGTTLLDIFVAIHQIIYYPSFEEPSNTKLMKMIGKEYEEFMREQTKRLSDPKYKVL